MAVGGVEVSAPARADQGGAIARRAKPDVLLVDVRTHDGAGIRPLHQMKRVDLPPCIIVLTNEAYPEIRS